MKRISYLIVVVLAASFFSFGSVRPAAASCVIAQASNPPTTTIFFNVITGHSYNYVSTILGTIFIGTAPFTGPFSEAVFGTVSIVDLSADCGAPGPLFNDGRENNFDALQTAAAYCGVPHESDLRVY